MEKQLISNCVYCGNDNSVHCYETTDIFGDSFTIRQCTSCEAYYLNPHPTAGQLNRAYGSTYYGEGEQKFNGFIQQAMDYFPRRRAKQIAKAFGNQGKVLDIGCGNGHFLQTIQQQGNIEIYGIEMPGNSAERAKQIEGLHLKIGALEESDFTPNTFDAITLFHVFEHLHNPAEMLDMIDRILKPGGILYISVPNIDSLQSRWFKGKWLHLDPPRHLFFFTPKKFTSMMSQRGYRLEREKHFNVKYNPYGMQQSVLNKLYPERDLLFEHLKGNRTYTQRYSSFHLQLKSLLFKLSFPAFIGLDMLEGALKKGATVEFMFRKQ